MAIRHPGIHPRPNLWRRLDSTARYCFAAASSALLLLAAAPLGLPGQAQMLIAAALGCVFFWSLFRPRPCRRRWFSCWACWWTC
jgi:rod shape-determining protein MreD